MSGPRWKIDDTTHPGRVFCQHLHYPRLIGELLPADEAPVNADRLPATRNRWLANIQWLENMDDGVCYEARDMYDSLAAALKAHEKARRQPPAPTRS